MATSSQATRRARRRRNRRRRAAATALAVVIVAGGAGTAWAMRGSDGPRYRLTTVTRGSIEQTVDADGSLTADQVHAATFSVGGTVASVKVSSGDRVSAGQVLATLDPTSLTAAVSSAEVALAQAKEQLTDAEDGISTSTASTGSAGSAGSTTSASTTSATGTSTTSTDSTDGIELTAARTSADGTAASAAATKSTTEGGATPGAGSVSSLRAQVTKDAAALATALSSELDSIGTACQASEETTGSTTTAAADSDGAISGVLGSQPGYVTLQDAGGAVLSQYDGGNEVAASGEWSFSALTAGQSYQVVVRHVTVDAASCAGAVTSASNSSPDVAAALSTFDKDVTALQAAVAAATAPSEPASGGSPAGASTSGGSTSGGSTSGGSAAGGSAAKSGASDGTGAAKSGSGAGSSSSAGNADSSGTSTSTTVTSEQLAADVAAVAQAKAEVALAENQAAAGTLTSPVNGTVADVAIAKGDAVSAGSSTDTITVLGTGLSVSVPIPLAKIDLIKVGQSATVTVDGQTTPLTAKVSYVGLLNSSDSTGSASTYPVTVQLGDASSKLYDGMGAQVSIAVGTASNVLVVPLSAVHTNGTRSTVDVQSGGKVTVTTVTLGVIGADDAQITKGLSAGEQIVLADSAVAVPSSNSGTTGSRTSTGSLSGLTSGAGAGAGGFGGGPPGGR